MRNGKVQNLIAMHPFIFLDQQSFPLSFSFGGVILVRVPKPYAAVIRAGHSIVAILCKADGIYSAAVSLALSQYSCHVNTNL